jgi:putative addiction module component (TIGR02574 family)
VDFSSALSAINAMSIDDRIRLVEAIWDGIASERPHPELSDDQKRELDRRLAAHEAAPDDVVPWEQVKAEAQGRLPQ